MTADLSGSQYSQTLFKALRILESLCAEQAEWGIRELGRELDINPATIYRLINTLNAMGYVEQNPDNQRYSLGPKVMKLAGAYTHQNPLPDIATRVFESYSERFTYNFYLGALSNFQVVYLAVLDGRGPIQVTVDPGATFDLHCTSLGKVLLAHQSEEYIREYLATHDRQKYTAQTITGADELLEHLSEIRRNGYALNVGEYFEDIGAVGVPVWDHSGRLTKCVSLGYPIPLMRGDRIQLDDVISLAKRIADEITLRLVGTKSGNLDVDLPS